MSSQEILKYCRRSFTDISPYNSAVLWGMYCNVYYLLCIIRNRNSYSSLLAASKCTLHRQQAAGLAAPARFGVCTSPHAASCKLRPPGHVTRAHAGGRQARAEIRLLVADTIQPVVAFASNCQIVYTSVFRASDCSNNFTCIIEKYVTRFDDLCHMFLKYSNPPAIP